MESYVAFFPGFFHLAWCQQGTMGNRLWAPGLSYSPFPRSQAAPDRAHSHWWAGFFTDAPEFHSFLRSDNIHYVDTPHFTQPLISGWTGRFVCFCIFNNPKTKHTSPPQL